VAAAAPAAATGATGCYRLLLVLQAATGAAGCQQLLPVTDQAASSYRPRPVRAGRYCWPLLVTADLAAGHAPCGLQRVFEEADPLSEGGRAFFATGPIAKSTLSDQYVKM